VPEPGEDDAVEIPIRETLLGHFKGITDRPRGMGKLIDHGLGGVQNIVLPAGVRALQTGKLAVQGYCPKNPVERKLIFPDQVDPVSGERGDVTFPGKGIAVGHVVARGHLNKEVLF
jgi:hypothetical protein